MRSFKCDLPRERRTAQAIKHLLTKSVRRFLRNKNICTYILDKEEWFLY